MEKVQQGRAPFPVPLYGEPYQQQLFSSDAIEKAGRPSLIDVPDPNRPERRRTLVVAAAKTRDLLGLLERAAPTTGTILLQGESGSGKNLLASFIHLRSRRRSGPFVQFSAGHHPENLVESELFGHEEGAYTGARGARPGKFEIADQGTLLIDEVGDLSPQVQLKLHRFFDDQAVERVGGTSQKIVDVRVVAATHRDLWALVKAGRFREDLYYRLSVVCLRVPPLRERPEEIPAIAGLLLDELSERHSKPLLKWDPRVLEILSLLPWPGNVRELRNTIERMVILSQGEFLRPEDLHIDPRESNPAPVLVLQDTEGDSKRRFLEVYQRCSGNRTAIAKVLGTSRSQVRRMINRHVRPESGMDQTP